MGSNVYKTNYEEIINPWGTTEIKQLYSHFNRASNHNLIYDENGEFIFGFTEGDPNNLYDAIQRVIDPYEDDGELKENVTQVNYSELEQIINTYQKNKSLKIHKEIVSEILIEEWEHNIQSNDTIMELLENKFIDNLKEYYTDEVIKMNNGSVKYVRKIKVINP